MAGWEQLHLALRQFGLETDPVVLGHRQAVVTQTCAELKSAAR